jgi:ketosteroid isomerase-like protein
MVEVDRPEVVAEVRAVFDRYEAALVANQVDTLNELFWPTPMTLRFGVGDAQVGFDQVARWRGEQGPLPPGRTLSDTRVVTFGDDVAVVTTLFRYPGRAMVGRQSQTWLRTPDGWRIASAHVSEVPDGSPPG